MKKLFHADLFEFDYDWNSLVESIKHHEGIPITTDPKIWRMEVPDYTKILQTWKDANYPEEMIKWINYYPEQHFSDDLGNSLCEHFKIRYRRAWISRIDPGYSAPWHWDVEDNPEEYEGSLRLCMFIQDGQPGHIFILGKEDYFYNMKAGQGIFWHRYNEYHIGMNAGLTPKYMYHLKAKSI
jgi:hypothetical protein